MDKTDLKNRFTYHAPRGTQPERYVQIRADALGLAELIDRSVPDSREKSLAITHLETCVMWANAGIAREQESPDATKS